MVITLTRVITHGMLVRRLTGTMTGPHSLKTVSMEFPHHTTMLVYRQGKPCTGCRGKDTMIAIVGWMLKGGQASTPELVVLPSGSLVTYTVLHTAHKL